MPDWNKEISFRRKREPAAEASARPEKQSIWKQEIGRSKKEKPGTAAEAATPWWKQEIGGGKKKAKPSKQAAQPVAAVEPSTPWWKKEIGGGKKQAKPSKQAAQPVAVAEATTPWWKKELGGGRKAKPPKQAAQPVAAVESSTPWWKKEIGGKKKAKQAAPAAEAPVPFWKQELSLGRDAGSTPEPVAESAPVPVPEPVAAVAAPPEEPEEDDYSWLTDRLDAYVPPLEPRRGEEPAGSWPPPSDGAPVSSGSWPPSSSAAPAPGPAPAPAPVADPVPVAVPAPVAAAPMAVPAPAAPAPAAEPPVAKVPFWKKELGGKKKEQAAKPPRAEKVPFWKRELGRPKAPKPVSEQPTAVLEAPAKVPFWKRELGGKKKDKTAKAPSAEKVPFWKRELGRSKAPKPVSEQPTAVLEAPGAKVPFWKKELSFGGGAKAPRPRAGKSKPLTSAAPRREKASIVGLKIGASQIAAARIQNNGSPHLVQLAREPLDDGIVVGGELRDVEALSEALKAFFARHKLPRKGVRLGIANNRIGVRTFEISGIEDPKQLANAIKFRAQETLPIPLEEAVLDWQVLREETDENGVTTRRVLLVVAYRELVDRYALACRKAGVRLDGIDLEAFAMLRALTVPAVDGEAPAGAQVVVNVGHDRSTFAVSDGRICEFTRVLAWGGQQLNVGIARALDLTPSEAAPLKHAMSLADGTIAIEGTAPERAAAACDAVRGELQAFARELVSSLRFYQNQPGSLGIAELTLTGGTAELPGLAAELEQLIGVSVRVGDPLSRLSVGKRFQGPEHAGSLAIAIGLGIED